MNVFMRCLEMDKHIGKTLIIFFVEEEGSHPSAYCVSISIATMLRSRARHMRIRILFRVQTSTACMRFFRGSEQAAKSCILTVTTLIRITVILCRYLHGQSYPALAFTPRALPVPLALHLGTLASVHSQKKQVRSRSTSTALRT
jgi:hypothetical protein